jgi:hypothetical protein
MSSRKTRRNPLFADAALEARLSPAVVSYPLAQAIVIFDPVGDRENYPAKPDEVDEMEIILVPDTDLIQADEPSMDTSGIA